MKFFDKKGLVMSESESKLKENEDRIEEISALLEAIPGELMHLEATLSTGGLKERAPIFKLKNERDQITTEKGELQRQNIALERVIRWEKQLADAPQVIKAAPKKILAAQKDLAKQGLSRERLSAKLNVLKAESARSHAQAIEGEQAAAKAYAAAMAAGDDTAETAALGKLEHASSEVRASAGRNSNMVIAALEAELQSLDAGIELAKSVLQELELEQLYAIRCKLAADWDKAARVLLEVGAKLHVVQARARISTNFFQSIQIPLSSRVGLGEINQRTIEVAGDGLMLSDVVAG